MASVLIPRISHGLALFLPFQSLPEHEVRAVRAELLVSPVHFLNLSRTQHELTRVLVNRAKFCRVRIRLLSNLADLEAKNSSEEHLQVGHYHPLAIILLLLLIFSIGQRLSEFFALQMLPDGLDDLQVTITVLLDEAKIHHNVDDGDFADARSWLDLKLLQNLVQIILKSAHEQLGGAIACLNWRRRLGGRLIGSLVQPFLLGLRWFEFLSLIFPAPSIVHQRVDDVLTLTLLLNHFMGTR